MTSLAALLKTLGFDKVMLLSTVDSNLTRVEFYYISSNSSTDNYILAIKEQAFIRTGLLHGIINSS